MKRALVVAAALICIFTTYLHADEESDRKQYLDDITKLLEGIAGDLDRVPGDSGTGSIDYAIRKADEVKDKAQRLANVRGSDDRAARYASYYPGYVDKFKDAAGYLRQMKERQRDLDALPRLCEDKERELAEKIRRYTDANNPDGVDAIPALGRELGKPLREAVERQERAQADPGGLVEVRRLGDHDSGSADADGLREGLERRLHDRGDQAEQLEGDCEGGSSSHRVPSKPARVFRRQQETYQGRLFWRAGDISALHCKRNSRAEDTDSRL